MNKKDLIKRLKEIKFQDFEVIFDNKIEMWNGGYLFFDEENLKKGYISEPRNPYIMKAFRGIGLLEDAGSGFMKIMTRWHEAGYNTPEIESDRKDNHFLIKFVFKIVKEEAPVKAPVELTETES